MRSDIKEPKLLKKILSELYPDLIIKTLNGITIDSRLVEPNDIFIALKGENSDGNIFIEDAFKAGASVCITEKKIDNKLAFTVSSTLDFLKKIAKKYRKAMNYPIIGITGSNGKTTTKELLTHVLSINKNIAYSKGNFNSTTGAPLSIFEFKKNLDVGIIEMGANKPGEIDYICEIIKPNMGVITNISKAHMKYFGSIENIAKTKSALFHAIPKSGTVFVNIDDKYINGITTNCNKIKYSFSQTSDYIGSWSTPYNSLIINNTEIKIGPPFYTLGLNALAVYSIASYLGVKSKLIKQQIESFSTPMGRGNIINHKNINIINDSYNANLESVKAGINNLKLMPVNGKKIVVIGDMLELGDIEKKHHIKLGEYLSLQKIDAVLAFGILTEYTIKAMNGSTMPHKYYNNKDKLIFDLKKIVTKRDTIYIKGSRGMKMEEVIKGLKE